MRKIIFVFAAILLTGCTVQKKPILQKTTATSIKSAILEKVYDTDIYANKSCRLRTITAQDGLLLDVKSEGGDPALCQALIAASRFASLPPVKKGQPLESVVDFEL